MKAIKSIAELKKLSNEKNLECFIALAGGIVRSSKVVFYADKKFYITNEIDGSEDVLTEKEIKNGVTNIAKAIKCGALIRY